MNNPSQTKVGMLTSLYPAISHTFIARDVAGLRERGFEVYTCSLNKPAETELLTDEYRDEFNNTFYIKATDPVAILAAHLNDLFRSPIKYLSSLYFALTSHTGGFRNALWNFFYFAEAGILAHWARRNRIQHIHVHFANAASSVAMLSARMGGPPFTVRVHGPDIFYDCLGLHLREKFIHAQTIVCISDFCKSQVLRLIPKEQWEKVSIVRCGVDPDKFAPQPRDSDENGTTHFLCVARLSEAKGLPVLLHACRILREKGVRFKCTIVGNGPDRDLLDDLRRRLSFEDTVAFVGSVGQDRIQLFYDQADVFVLPSFAEGVPVVLMEAMAMELPVISTRIMGIPELVEDEVNGLLVPPANVEQLVDAMQRLAEDADLRRRLGKAGREKVVAEYNLELNVKKLAQVLQKCIGGEADESITSPRVIEEVQT